MKLALALFLIAAPAMAMAQTTLVLLEPYGYTVIPPSGPSTHILREPGGGYLILAPGKPSAIILPQPGEAPSPFATHDNFIEPGNLGN